MQFERTYTLSPRGPSDWTEVTLDLAELSGHQNRAVLLEAQATELVKAAAGQPVPPPLRGLYRLTDLGPVGIKSQPQSILAVMRLSSGRPVAEATLTLRFRQPGAIEAFYEKPGVKQLPSFSIADPAAPAVAAELAEAPGELVYRTPQLTARIQKSPLRVSYWRGDELLLAEEAGGYAHQTVRGFRFALSEGEKLIGGGQRVLGMDRRGHRLPLYNKPHYGYTTQSEQMYFSMPAVLSSRKYLLLFDNSASGFMDLGKTEPGILEFQAVGGRTGYLVFAAPDYPGVMQQYVKVTGTQPLPPRWALGNYASRFGYRSEAEVRATVQKFIDLGIPLDAVVIDLYWFGKDIQGHLGKLDWDRNTFPTPVEMMADLKAKGVNTILVTEPFILTTSTRWQEAVDAGVLAKDLAGRPKTFDFYFGNTGLIDVFKPEAAQWFWGIYAGLMRQGVAGSAAGGKP